MFHDYGWWMMAGPLFWIVVIGVIVYAILNRSRHYPGGPGLPHQEETPLDILKKRYAKGEITRDQYEQMKKDLGY
ncbi:MAG TPA: SHOCT domain-containing protein [Ignavibacteriales bacterium]|nr:SHOCT domain-containing protein [Ignavibacteriales bacterium]